MTAARLTILCSVCCLLTTIVFVPSHAGESPKNADTTVTKELRKSLLGAWALAGAIDSENDPQPGARMKFWGLQHWVITQADPETGEVVFHHGGTYTLDGDSYAEKVTFATEGTKTMIGTTLKFKIKVDGDTYTQMGIGNGYNERWVRLKNN